MKLQTPLKTFRIDTYSIKALIIMSPIAVNFIIQMRKSLHCLKQFVSISNL